MKKRFLTLALVAIPLLSSCGKMKEVDYTTWKAVYDSAVKAKPTHKYSKIRIKGVTDGDKFDSGFVSLANPNFDGLAEEAHMASDTTYITIGFLNLYQGNNYTLLVSGKNYGFIYATAEAHFNEYALVNYYSELTAKTEFTIYYK